MKECWAVETSSFDVICLYFCFGVFFLLARFFAQLERFISISGRQSGTSLVHTLIHQDFVQVVSMSGVFPTFYTLQIPGFRIAELP